MILSGGSLNCVLVQAHYDAGCSDSRVFSMAIPVGFSIEHLDMLLGTALKMWAKEIDWDLVKCQDDLCLLSLDGSESVRGATLAVDPEYLAGGNFHSFVLGVDAVVMDDQFYVDAAAKYFDVTGASSLVFVLADWNEVRVLVVAKGRPGLGNEGKLLIRELKIEGDALDKVVETAMEHVLSIHMRKDTLIDVISNLRDRKPTGALSEQVYDVGRAFLTAALINMRDIGLQAFGVESERGVLCATGPLVRLLPQSHSSLAIIDGLQLRGTFVVGIDNRMLAYAGGISYVQRRFAFPIGGVFPHRYLYLSPEKGATGRSGETAFRGRVVGSRNGNAMEKLVLGQTGQIATISVDEGEQVLLEPAKSVYFPNLGQVTVNQKRYLQVDIQKGIGNVVVDCRSIPVVYGPDAHTNLGRVSGWTRSFGEIFRERRKGDKK